MDTKGTIHVSASNTELPYNNPYNLKPGNYVLISIKDEGEGISRRKHQENFRSLFTPLKKEDRQKEADWGLRLLSQS